MSPLVVAAEVIREKHFMAQECMSLKKITKTVHLNYLLYLPEGYGERKDWPLVMFLHGEMCIRDSSQTLGLVGESGCGKSTIGRCIVRLTKPTRGEILFHSGGSTVDLAKLEDRDLQAMRTKIQMVFQDPFSSINPRLTIGDTLEEPLQVHGLRDSAARQDRVVELLEMVGLKGEHTERFPHELSGCLLYTSRCV